MNDRESNLLFGLLALQLNYISKEQLVSATASWVERQDEELAEILLRRGYITGAQVDAITGLVSAHIARTSGRGLPDGYVPTAKELAETIMIPKTGATKTDGEPAAPAPPLAPGERFQLGSEIGRGGLARVVEATDGEIGRTVALKLMLEDAPGDAIDRFRYEAKITGRLEHPNIVPVHEVGVLPGSKEIYFCMKRIYGRDMHQVIREGKWKQRRLVEAFRDVCRAVAYAHAKGVIHRDLKPANVMLGDFGETLVVDWGLAIVKGEEGAGRVRGGRANADPAQTSATIVFEGDSARPITEEGEILGTPAYMPPEQAMGRRGEVDERSDVYSLGAILYEILTARPPFEGRTAQEVIKRVANSPLMPPSSRVAVPPELEAICLRAMSRRREDRYPTAAELAADVESYLEGTKERERREGLAAEQVARAKSEIERWRRLAAEAHALSEEAQELEEQTALWEGVEKKRRLWEMEDRVKSLERESITAFTEANGALTSALSNVPGHPEARALKAELFWEKFLEAEAAADDKAMLLNRQTAEQFNDGVLDARLRGDGTLAVRTSAYGCRCLRQGRLVRPEELDVLGHHPWSGRRTGEEDAHGLPMLEPAESLTLRLHAASCARAPLPGAQVWAFRFEERDRLLVPVTPHGGASIVPRSALDALWGDSPFRPRGGGVYLGRTPIPKQPWPMGSWILVVVAEGRAPQRVPLHLGRQEDADLDVTLFAPEEIPAGFLPIAAGPFTWQGDLESLSPVARQSKTLGDFFIARHPVTCRDWAAFLNDLHALDPAEAARRVPRASERSGFTWPLVPGKGYAVPTREWLEAAPAEIRAAAARLPNTLVDWEEDWPVTAISWEDMLFYARHQSLRLGRVLHLPHEEQWEKAARGPDARTFPWGHVFDATCCNISGSHKEGPRPMPVASFPADESPYGVRGLGGNTSDRCLNEPGHPHEGRKITRGGNWARSAPMARATYRSGGVGKEVHVAIGFRLACAVM